MDGIRPLSADVSKDDAVVRTLLNIFNAVERGLAERKLWIVSICGLLALQCILIFTHQPWLDEWQALQIAVQSPDLPALFENLRYEGHPPAWYFILQGFALMVPIFWVLPAAQTLMVIPMQLMILLRCPFARTDRLLIASSYFLLFEFGTISRSLSMGAMLLVMAMTLRKRRAVWMAISLLPMADFVFGVLSLFLVILAWRDRNWSWTGFFSWVLMGLFAAYSVRPPTDLMPAILPEGIVHDGLLFLNHLSALLLPIHMVDNVPNWFMGWPYGIGLFGGLLFIWFAWQQCVGRPFDRIILFTFIGFTFLFSIFLYPLGIRHLTLIPLLLILLKWRAIDQGAEMNGLFRLWLAGAATGGLFITIYSMIVPFDTVKSVAIYIRNQGLANKQWIAFPDYKGQGITALTGIEFQRLDRNCTQSFMRWDHRPIIKERHHLRKVLRTITNYYGRVYMVSDVKFHLPVSEVKQVKYIPAGYVGQPYYLYVVRPDLPEKSLRAPQCAPKRLKFPNA